MEGLDWLVTRSIACWVRAVDWTVVEMADGIRIRTLLSPGVPRGLRAEMFTHQQDLDAVAQDLQTARDMVEAGDLQGATADRLFDAMTDNTDNAKTLVEAVKALVEALGALADALTSTGLWFDNLADAAVAEHLEVTEDEIIAPADPTNPAYDAQVEAYSQFCEESYEIYEKERKAYEDFESACQNIAGPLAWVAGEVVPDWSLSGIGKFVGLLENVNTAALWGAIRAQNARFAPRWPKGATNAAGQKIGGQLRSLKNMNPLEKRWLMTKPENWVAGKGKAKSLATTVRRFATKAGEHLSRIGIVTTVLDGALSAKDQWDRDALNPQIGTGERIARATTTGALTGLGAYGGSVLGANIGASIGTVGGPIGIAAGTIVGGIIGGIAGSSFGSGIANSIKGGLSALFHW